MSKLLHEIHALMKLALPVSLAQLALVGMTATDVLIAGNASTVDLAGMNLGANIWNMLVLFFMGIGFATQPMIARQFGAQNHRGVKHQLHQSMWMCLVLGVLAMGTTWLAALLLLLVDYEPGMLRIGHDYLLAISLCAIPSVLIPAVRGALEGMSLTRPVFWINLTAFLFNIPMDYALVNGVGGLPELGGVGCAWATVFLIWCMFLVNIAVLAWHKQIRHLKLLSGLQMPHSASIAKTLRLGFPIGISIVIELSMFSGAGILIASFGAVQASAHAVAITIAAMAFMLYVGLAQGVTIRASQCLGAGQPGSAWYTVKSGTAFNLLVAIGISAIFLTCNQTLVRLFTSDPEVIKLAVVLMYFAAAFQIADSLQVAVICALRAYHDTASPPKYQIFAFWIIGLPLGIGLGFYGWWPGFVGA
ncbi:MAG: MATE family efflux transporter, partial [Gammaproteobacteria bacterium]|nr:MATE family efflux transporter [Gammaproteobacteria bacterium]